MATYLSPPQIASELVAISRRKAEQPLAKLLVLGILAGVYIGFAAQLATLVGTGWEVEGTPILYGLKKLVMGAVFSVGLMLVLLAGSELWTGNCLMSTGLCEKRISLISLLRNWAIVWCANLLGAVCCAWCIASLSGLNDGAVGTTALTIAAGKCSLTPTETFVRAIAANWLVCIAVMLCYSAQDLSGKMLGIFFPVMAFVASGYEHSIANMYFLPAGLFTRLLPQAIEGTSPLLLETINLTNVCSNIALVTAGNFVGGSIFVGVGYWFVYLRNTTPQKKEPSHIRSIALEEKAA